MNARSTARPARSNRPRPFVLGVCSWSLRPSSPEQLARDAARVGVTHVQLALDPIRRGEWDFRHTQLTLKRAGIRIASGMMGMAGEDYSTLASIRRTGGVRRRETWTQNFVAAKANAQIARRLGISLVTFHAGFLPERRGDAARGVIVARLAELAGIFAARGVRVGLETGQESAQALLEVLDDLNRSLAPAWRVGVNFDPANMILYDKGDPVAALRTLLPHVVQVHAKDARRTARKGQWGAEVSLGRGEVHWPALLRLVRDAGVPVMIEREAGERRVQDAAIARRLVESTLRRDPAARARPTPNRPIGIGVIGLGFMGRTHLAAYAGLANARTGGANVRVVAVCDERAGALDPKAGAEGNLASAKGKALWDPWSTRVVTRPSEVFADPDVDAVSICTPTDTHKPLAIEALRAGKHVLVEKPVALGAEDVGEIERARRGLVCMPAMCMRFWPGWSWLKSTAQSRRFGRLTSLVLQRLGTAPGWSRSFYSDPGRSGGALVDLHIHDADFVLWLLGMPDEVVSAGTRSHVATIYRYSKRPGLLVSAEGSWDHAPGWPFRMRYVATFERATAEYELGRSDPLVLTKDGTCVPVALDAGTGYDAEIAHFVRAVARARRGARAGTCVDLSDAQAVASLLSAEARSLSTGRAVRIPRTRRNGGTMPAAAKPARG